MASTLYCCIRNVVKGLVASWHTEYSFRTDKIHMQVGFGRLNIEAALAEDREEFIWTVSDNEFLVA